MSYFNALAIYGGIIVGAFLLLILAERSFRRRLATNTASVIRSRPLVQLKRSGWSRFCLRCELMQMKLRRVVPVVLTTLAATLAIPALIGCIGLLKKLSWKALDAAGIYELFPPNFPAEGRMAILALVISIALFLIFYWVVSFFAKLGKPLD